MTRSRCSPAKAVPRRVRGGTDPEIRTADTTTRVRRCGSAWRVRSCSIPTTETWRSRPVTASTCRHGPRTRRPSVLRDARVWRPGVREGRLPRRPAVVLGAGRDRDLRRALGDRATRGRVRRGARAVLGVVGGAAHTRRGPGWDAFRRDADPRAVPDVGDEPAAVPPRAVRRSRRDPRHESGGDRAGEARAGARRDDPRPRVRTLPRAVSAAPAPAVPARARDRATRGGRGAHAVP